MSMGIASPLPNHELLPMPPDARDPLVIGVSASYSIPAVMPSKTEPGAEVPVGPAVTPSKAAVTPLLGALVHMLKREGPTGVLRQPVPALEPGVRKRLFYCYDGYAPDEAPASGVAS